MTPVEFPDGRDTLVRHLIMALEEGKYLPNDGRNVTYEAVNNALMRMAKDASAHGNRPTVATGRDVALSFLRATVEDAQKPMAERMDAARMLLMHSGAEK